MGSCTGSILLYEDGEVLEYLEVFLVMNSPWDKR